MKSEIDAVIGKILSKGDLIMRRHLSDFENNMASFLGVKYAIGVGNCTDALYFSLRAAGIGRGDEVITVSHTFVATLEAIVHCGAKPVLVDIGEDFNMDVQLLEKAITLRTKAILPVHLNGRLCDMGNMMAIARKYNLVIIEDAAQALGATFDGKKAGSFGLTGCFSFYPAKLLGALGDGGLVCTNSKSLARKIRLLRDHGRESKNKLAFYGFNSRLDNLQAAVLDVKLKHVPQWIQRRRELANIYTDILKDVREVKLPLFSGNNDRFFDVYQNYVIRAQKRDKLSKYLKKHGIEILISNPIPVHHQKALNLCHFRLPNTERFAKEVISLPLFPELSDKQVAYTARTVRNFYKNS
ncbi:DegT/DnrJ/EryC1/StrS family aminotransferase, partial [Candidatus Omnitrophota bacterium]